MDFNVYSFDYNNRIRNLDVEAKGVVKSTKFFPIINIDKIKNASILKETLELKLKNKTLKKIN